MTRFAVLFLLLPMFAACTPLDLAAGESTAALHAQSVPSSCDERKSGVTALSGSVVVTEYRGVRSGRNGDHELIEGTFTADWIFDAAVVDSDNVELALNVASNKDPSGLPHELPLAVGASFAVTGEYIPAATANASNHAGAAAVIHFTHQPCGSVTIAGHTYQ